MTRPHSAKILYNEDVALPRVSIFREEGKRVNDCGICTFLAKENPQALHDEAESTSEIGNRDDVLREEVVNKLAIDPGKLRECGLNIVAQMDVPGERARIWVNAFLFGDIRGIDTHRVL